MDAPPSQEHGGHTRILFAYQRWDARVEGLCQAIVDENRYDVTPCPLRSAKIAFADHDILVTERGTLVDDPQMEGKRIYRGDELIRHLKAGDRNPGLAVIVLSDIQDPTAEYDGMPPLKEPNIYFRENIAGHVNEYFRYPFDLALFLLRLQNLDTDRN